ncbi:PREDICTED: ATP synthase subunit g, mitochondrial-like [Priapulus caudatus]|uniref:ATP synthase subunit g n=1 Tax=Priapulus caudatus TaxID=37621 RepID=A0ABM1EJ77_PRICU|nr:PREDICTED: ATP synthase subunit g, mitochondrial-like [Priapulus caudatus]
MANVVQKLTAAAPGLAKRTQAFAVPRLQTFWRYAKVEMTPPSPAEFPAVQKGFQNLATAWRTQKWKELSVREGWQNTLVGAEIVFWFFVGEVIGRRHIVGYKV